MREKAQGNISDLVTGSEVENCVIATCGRGSDAGGDRGPRLHVELAGFEGTVDGSVEFPSRKISAGAARLIEAGSGARRGVWSWQRRELEKAVGSGVTSGG